MELTLYYINKNSKAGSLKRANFINEADMGLFIDVFKDDITIVTIC